ncbi:beta/gamma crystallin domain-containing protein 2 isoform X2 [Cavia porcellus]|uniref:beta/gamma crystallin domain-containing protein 2 isoform X2 n=1 Tax=Cavia porcellus TaxID=10141 RepID=UPI002FE0A2D1
MSGDCSAPSAPQLRALAASGQVPTSTLAGGAAVCSEWAGGADRRRRSSRMQRIREAQRSGVQTAQAWGLGLAMTERRGGLGARLARLLAGLGARRERRGKATSEEAKPRDRPWGGQSCPDLAQGQGSTSDVRLKVQAQSHSEWDLRVRSQGGIWSGKPQQLSGRPAQPLGRLQRPAVGSASDLANYASVAPKDLAPAETSAERDDAHPGPTPQHMEQGTPGRLCQQPPHVAPDVTQRLEPPSNLENTVLPPHPACLPEVEGAKGERDISGPVQSESFPLHSRPSARRTRYHITVILQGCGQTPGEEGEEPAQPAPHPCGPEESRGWQEPPLGLRPVTGCLTDLPQEPQLRALPLHQGSTAQWQAGRKPGSPHGRALDCSVTETPLDRLPGPNMEEAAGPPARAEARVVSATLTWRQRPPAQEEIRHHFHKVSLVSGAREEMFGYTYAQEEVNGFATREEETVNHQGLRDEAGSANFQSHGPIFSKKYMPPPKEKKLVGRPKWTSDQTDSIPQAPRTEPPGLGAAARTELLVPLPGPRDPSPHPGGNHTGGSTWNREECRVTRTVRTTTVVGGHVDHRMSSSVTVGPMLSSETLPRGRHVVRSVRAAVVNPQAEDSPSRSKARELLGSLVAAESSSPASRLPRPTNVVPRSPGLGGTEGTVLEQLPETGTAQPKVPAGSPVGPHPPQNHEVPTTCPDQDQGRALDIKACEPLRVQGASSPTPLPPQTSRGQTPVPSSPRLQTRASSPGLAQRSEQPVLASQPRAEPSPQPRPHGLPSVEGERLADPPAAPTPPVERTEAATVPGQPLIPPSITKKPVPSPGGLSAASSRRSKFVQDSENVPLSSLTQKEVLHVPGAPSASSPKPTKVTQGPEGDPSTQKEVAKSIPTPSLPKEETVQGPAAPVPLLLKEEEASPGARGSPVSSSTQKEDIQSPAVSFTPSSVGKETPSPGGTPVSVPVETEASTESQLVPDSVEDKSLPESSNEEDEMALAADLEIFLDTLRSMEPPEILRTHRLPRAPRSSYLAMYATLPAIDEDHPGPWMLGPSPQVVPTLEEEKEKVDEKEEEELENPYLSDDEKLQRRQEKAGPSPSWGSRPARPTQDSCSPLEMMKKHVADAKSSHPELGLELQTGTRPTSRLGSSILFSNLVPATKEAPSLEPLGAKLSVLPPHPAPGLRKVPGQLPLLCSGRPPPEKLTCAQPLEGWSPSLKKQGKLNTRPGKVIFFSEPGCQGSSREVYEDIADASGWDLVASIRVVRGCWVLYEQPQFQGQKLVLPEGDVELRGLRPAWSTHGIGSLRRVVRDYCTPEIILFSEEGLKGEQVKLTEALKDPEGLERPLQVASATVSAGLWMLYPKPFFEDTPYILEPGEYPTLEAWGTSNPTVGSLKPMTLGCPSVEKPAEPKAVVYEAPDFQGKSWEVSRDIYNLQQPEDSQSPDLASVGSLRVLGGCWVGYEKAGFRGHQYLLEEGEYADWSHWGGYDELLTSLRIIRTDFGDPAVVLFEAMDFQGHGVEVSTALPDVELMQHGPHTQAIHVLSGVWVAYEQVGFSGEQYVLEKGVYRNCDDWGAGNSALASLQPVLQVGEHDLHFVSKIQLFSGPDFLGEHLCFEDDQACLPPSFQPQSCRVLGGSWILFDGKNFEGDQHILSEGEFPTLMAMGCLASTVLGSLRKVPLHFSEPAIFLYGLECFEGKEIELSGEVRSLQAQGFNNHVLSVRIKGGVWVLCEHSDFRGHQWLVSSCEITNWLTYSGTQRVGSLYPIKQMGK